MSADNQNTPPPAEGTGNGADKVSEQLAALGEVLKSMNQRMEATEQALATANQRLQPKPDPEPEDNLYDPKNVLAKVDRMVSERVNQVVNDDRQKNTTIYNLTQDYPEIQSDAKVRESILAAQKELRADMKDTAQGYELAVLKAVSKHGLIPKSRRPEVDPDASLAPRGAGQRRPTDKKAKLSDDQLAVAELMGINLDDKQRMERLEQANNRSNYLKWE